MITTDRKDKGTLHALLVHSSNTQLPRLLKIHKKVSCGCQMDEVDMVFMREVCQVTGTMKSLMDAHPDYHDFLSRYISLIREVTSLALANEMAAGASFKT
jgi:hypothetical protein